MVARKKNKKSRVKIVVLQYVILAVFFAALTFFICDRTRTFLTSAPMFVIRDVGREASLQFIQSPILDQLKGRNIFAVNLRSVQRALQAEYPEVDRLRIERRFPDTIYLSARKREPFAYIAAGSQDILLDRNGYVLSLNTLPVSQWPSILGVPLPREFALGKPLRSEQLRVALEIISAGNENPHLRDRPILSVDVTQLSKIAVRVTGDVTVFLDRDKIVQRVTTLGILLREGDLDLAQISYIDLRFKEPILGKKETSNKK